MKAFKSGIGRFMQKGIVLLVLVCVFASMLVRASTEIEEAPAQEPKARVEERTEAPEQPTEAPKEAPEPEVKEEEKEDKKEEEAVEEEVDEPEATAPAETVPEETAPEETASQEPEQTPEIKDEPKEEATPQPEVEEEPTEVEPEPTPEPAPPVLTMESRSGTRANTRLKDLIYLDGGLAIPYLAQGDYKTKIAQYGEMGLSVRTSGSAATSMSMVAAYLTWNTDQTPYTQMYDALAAGHFDGREIGHEGLNYLAERNWIEYRWIEREGGKIRDALTAGRPVIAHMGRGTFADEESYVVLRGLSEDGQVYVSDPSSKARSKKTYALSMIMEESVTERPFMICWADGMPMPGADEMPTPEAESAQTGYTVSVTVINAKQRYQAGDEVVLGAKIDGKVESPSYQWQYATPESPEAWTDVKGATGYTHAFIIDDDNCQYLWRVVVMEG